MFVSKLAPHLQCDLNAVIGVVGPHLAESDVGTPRFRLGDCHATYIDVDGSGPGWN